MEDDLKDLKGIMVEEHTEGKYDSSEFILSKFEKKRIHKVRTEVIVKLLERRVNAKQQRQA